VGASLAVNARLAFVAYDLLESRPASTSAPSRCSCACTLEKLQVALTRVIIPNGNACRISRACPGVPGRGLEVQRGRAREGWGRKG